MHGLKRGLKASRALNSGSTREGRFDAREGEREGEREMKPFVLVVLLLLLLLLLLSCLCNTKQDQLICY
jgi:hypothetical protein